MYRRVSQDREVLRFWRDENQDRIAMPSLIHAQLYELVRGRVTRVGNFPVTHISADFT